MANSPTISRAKQALRRLAALNRFALEMNALGRRAGLHNRTPWRERLTSLPPDAVPLTPEEIQARGWNVGPLPPEPGGAGEPAAAAEVREAYPCCRTRKSTRTAARKPKDKTGIQDGQGTDPR
jgi:hypothetical protein